MTDDPMPASFVWTDDDTGPQDWQAEPEGPALGRYPSGYEREVWTRVDREAALRHANGGWRDGVARFLTDLAARVRGSH